MPLDADLADELERSPRVASLATLREDGSVHVVAMWFLWDGQRLLLPTAASSAKARHLSADPRATVMVHDSRGGFDVRGVTVTGRAELITGQAATELNAKVHRKYIMERGCEIPAVADFLTGDDATIRIEPLHVSTWDETATEAAIELRESGEFVPPGAS